MTGPGGVTWDAQTVVAMRWRAGSSCGLYIDLLPGEAAAAGDWIATAAGARYVIDSARHVVARDHNQRNRWQLRVVRLDYDCEVPADVHCWWLRWHPRRRRARR